MFYSRAEAQVPSCFRFALRLARGGHRGLLHLAARVGVGRKMMPGAGTGQSGPAPRACAVGGGFTVSGTVVG